MGQRGNGKSRRDLPAGVRDAITGIDRLILVVGPNAQTSEYVRWEWEYALRIGKPVVPVLRLGDDTLLPPELKGVHYIDFRTSRAYDEALDELERILRTPIAPLGKLIAVPDLPPQFLPRPDELDALKELVLTDVNKPVVVTGTARRVGVQGMGGIGKSVLAAAERVNDFTCEYVGQTPLAKGYGTFSTYHVRRRNP